MTMLFERKETNCNNHLFMLKRVHGFTRKSTRNATKYQET